MIKLKSFGENEFSRVGGGRKSFAQSYVVLRVLEKSVAEIEAKSNMAAELGKEQESLLIQAK